MYFFSKRLFILYKVLLDIRHSSILAYVVNEYTPVLTQVLRSFLENGVRSEYLSLMPPPGSTGKLQSPRDISQAQLCGG